MHSPKPTCSGVGGLGFGVWGLYFRVEGLGLGVWGFGFRVPGFGFQVSGFGFRSSGFGFRVSGFGLRALDLETKVSCSEFRASGPGAGASKGAKPPLPGADSHVRLLLPTPSALNPTPYTYLRLVDFMYHSVFKAHRLCVSLNSRLESYKEEKKERGGRACLEGGEVASPRRRLARQAVAPAAPAVSQRNRVCVNPEP